MRPNPNIAPVEWPYRETDKSPGDVVITNVGRAMPSARATHAPHRANLRCLGLAVGIAIALAGCTDTLENDVECVLNATGDKFTAKAGDRTEYIGNREAIRVSDASGFSMFVTSWNADKWRCRGTKSGEAA